MLRESVIKLVNKLTIDEFQRCFRVYRLICYDRFSDSFDTQYVN
jgi:hypothetical protein